MHAKKLAFYKKKAGKSKKNLVTLLIHFGSLQLCFGSNQVASLVSSSSSLYSGCLSFGGTKEGLASFLILG